MKKLKCHSHTHTDASYALWERNGQAREGKSMRWKRKQLLAFVVVL